MNKLALWFWAAMATILICGLAIYFWPQEPTTHAAGLSPTDPPPATEPLSEIPVVENTATPLPWRFPAGAQIGSVVIGGMTESVAAQTLQQHYANSLRPIKLESAAGSFILRPSDINLTLPITDSLAEARRLSESKARIIRLPLRPIYDSEALTQRLLRLEESLAFSPTVGYSATLAAFVLTPGLRLDHEASKAAIAERLGSANATGSVELVTVPVTTSVPLDTAALNDALASREAAWGGIVGISVWDLGSGERFGYREDTVFSGMSVLKIPILLQAFISRDSFTKSQYEAIDLMIQISDNDASNELLALIGDGDGLAGVEIMDTTLQDVLGVEYTRLVAPFESITYLQEFVGIDFPDPGSEGPAPYTDADPYVRATPAEMTTVVKAIVDCSKGYGPLLDMEETALNVERCLEILDILSKNQDTNKIVAGVPSDAFVAHKSGWIDDCRADSGYVRAANGTEYVVSLWIWDEEYIETEVSDPLLADLSRIIYTWFHPQVLN